MNKKEIYRKNYVVMTLYSKFVSDYKSLKKITVLSEHSLLNEIFIKIFD